MPCGSRVREVRTVPCKSETSATFVKADFVVFNALLSADHPLHHGIPLPEYHESLIPDISGHIARGTLKPDHYCSTGVTVETSGEDYSATQ